MALTIYGSARSRTMRVLWAAAELGLTYDHVPYEHDDPALKQADYLRLNPAGTIPAIDDNGVIVTESLAIILYLTKTYGRGGPQALYPTDPAGEAAIWRWALWAQGHLEPWVQRDPPALALRADAGAQVQALLTPALAYLNETLHHRPWLLGPYFTTADLTVASVLSPSRTADLDLRELDQLSAWLDRCQGRPAAVRAHRRFA